MVFSEIAAATLIAVCGLKKSYRIVLRGERIIRHQMKAPQPIVEGYDTFPRFFIRRVFRAGLGIAMKWEGRAKNAAQRAAEARLTALRARKRVANRAEDLRVVAKDARVRAREVTEAVKSRAEDVRLQAGAVRERVNKQLEKRAKDAEKIPKTTSSSTSARTGIVPPPKSTSTSDEGTTLKMVRTRFDS